MAGETDQPKAAVESKTYLVGVSKYESNGGNILSMDAQPKAPSDGVSSNAMEWEDDFKGVYGIGKLLTGAALIEPPYNMSQLESLCDKNNALRPCIDTMITNVDGTGWVIELAEPEEEDVEDGTTGKPGLTKPADTKTLDLIPPALQDQEKAKEKVAKVEDDAGTEPLETPEAPKPKPKPKKPKDPKIDELEEFFKEPWPGMSFTTMRKKLRRDMERTGNGFLEVIRDVTGTVVFVRHIEAKTMRLITLDAGFWTPMKVQRGGKEVELTVHVRRRRYAQKINEVMTFFKEFGAEKDIDREHGNWYDAGSAPTGVKLGSEVLHFIVDKDVNTPYGVPRWISQTPSILGSRAAEEYNLAYFAAGGVPPAMILVSGGQLAPSTAQALDAFMSASPNTKNRALVVEIAGGQGASISDSQKVDVKVEKFGDAQTKDSMFEGYDTNCEKRVRRAFRIPPLFVGLADDYSYASAYASYIVAEAQVFKPERDEFDEMITLTLVRALTGSRDYVYRSEGLSVVDVAEQLKALEAAMGRSSITHEQYIDSLNELARLDLKVNPDADVMALETQKAALPDPADRELTLAEKKLGLKDKELGHERQRKEIDQIGKPPPLDPNKAQAKAPVRKGEGTASENYVRALAQDVVSLVQKGDYGIAYRRAMEDVGVLDPQELAVFREEFSQRTFGQEFSSEMTEDLLANSLRVLGQNPEPEVV